MVLTKVKQTEALIMELMELHQEVAQAHLHLLVNKMVLIKQ